MKHFFTITFIIMSFVVFGQLPNTHVKRWSDTAADEDRYATETAPSEREFVQIYDSVLRWNGGIEDFQLKYKTTDFQYVNNHKVSSIDYKLVDNQWIYSYTMTWGYDEKNRRISDLTRQNSDTIYLWTYAYDDNDNLIKREYYERRNDTLSLRQRTNQLFDDDNNLIQKTYYSVSNSSSSLKRYTYTYYSNNEIKQILTERSVDAEWVTESKEEYESSVLDKTSTRLKFSWVSTEWILFEKEIKNFDDYGNIVSTITQKRYAIDEELQNHSKTTNVYDVNNFLTFTDVQLWEGDQWTNYWQENWTNDSKGNLIKCIEESWDVDHWKIAYITRIARDDNNFILSSSHHNVYGAEEYIDSTYNYYRTTLGLNENPAEETKIYPNPVISEFRLESPFSPEKLELYNLSGVLVRVFKLSDRTHNIADLPNGLYLLKVSTGHVGMYQKLIKLE